MVIKNPNSISYRISSASEITVEVVQDIASLEKHLPAWEDLVSAAVEPNPFFEPWMLLPAIRALGSDVDLLFVLVYASRRGKNQEPVLCGFFPMQRQRRYKGLPVSVLRLWKYLHCFCSTPLIRAGIASKTLQAFFDWLAKDRRSCPLIEFPEIAGEGVFYQELAAEFWRRDCYRLETRLFTRAVIHPRQSSDEYLQAVLTRDKKQNLKRRRRRLCEQGELRTVFLDDTEEVMPWIEDFLELEASGWKGRNGTGTALACDERNRLFFSEMTQAGFHRGQIVMSALLLDDRPIAMSCRLLAPPGCFAFKVAHDERYAVYGPGVMLAIEDTRMAHDRPQIEWVDSCTSPKNNLMKSLWEERKVITTVVASTGKRWGDIWIAVLPLLRWCKRACRRAK